MQKEEEDIIERMSGRNAEDADAIHMYTGSPKRYFDSEWQLLTAHGYAAIFENEGEDFSECKEGCYDVRLLCWECPTTPLMK